MGKQFQRDYFRLISHQIFYSSYNLFPQSIKPVTLWKYFVLITIKTLLVSEQCVANNPVVK